MVELPSLHRYDLLTAAVVVAIIAFAYLVHPTHLMLVSAWLTVITISLCWLGFFVYRLAYGEVAF